MQPLKTLLIAALIAPMPTLAAAALTTEQRNVLNHFAQVSVIAQRCKDYQANDRLLGALIKRYRVDMDQAEAIEFRQTRYRQHMEGMDAAGDKVGCLVGWSLYGAGGENVPGLLLRRR